MAYEDLRRPMQYHWSTLVWLPGAFGCHLFFSTDCWLVISWLAAGELATVGLPFAREALPWTASMRNSNDPYPLGKGPFQVNASNNAELADQAEITKPSWGCSSFLWKMPKGQPKWLKVTAATVLITSLISTGSKTYMFKAMPLMCPLAPSACSALEEHWAIPSDWWISTHLRSSL